MTEQERTKETEILLSHFPWLTQMDVADYWADRAAKEVRKERQP